MSETTNIESDAVKNPRAKDHRWLYREMGLRVGDTLEAVDDGTRIKIVRVIGEVDSRGQRQEQGAHFVHVEWPGRSVTACSLNVRSWRKVA